MIKNPFTPSEIAIDPDDFFGRNEELVDVQRALHTGSVALQGAIGIGKSSLLGRAMLSMEGFETDEHSKSIMIVGNKDLGTIDDVARLALEKLIDIDETKSGVKLGVKGFFEYERGTSVQHFADGRHLATLMRVIEKNYLSSVVNEGAFFIIAVDEADKCPVVLARFFRALVTHAQQAGVKNLRFALAGVHPFIGAMIEEDPGVGRFLYRTFNLQAFSPEETSDLLQTKFSEVAKSAEEDGLDLRFDPIVIDRITRLSGGHPHIVQLLGSHIIEHELDDPDNIIDSRDLSGSLFTICYQDRGWVYESILHRMEANGMLDDFFNLLSRMSRSFPTMIERGDAQDIVEAPALEWFTKQNIIAASGPDHYILVDEFLKVRCYLDADLNSGYGSQQALEEQILLSADGRDYAFAGTQDDDEDAVWAYEEEFDDPERY